MAKIDSSTTDLSTHIIAQDILERSSSQPIYLSSIEVAGGETFSSDFFSKLLSPLMETRDFTLGKLVSNIEQSYDKLKNTEVFSDVSVGLSPDYSQLVPSNIKSYNSTGDKIIPTKVKFDLKAINLNIGEYILHLDNDTPLNLRLNYLNNNFNSNAELVKVGVDYNPYKPSQHLITNGRLVTNLNDPKFKFLIDFYNTNQNNQVWQQCSEKALGGLIGLQYNNIQKNLKVSTGLGLLKRTLHDINESAIEDVKAFRGDFLKSSIVNDLTYSNVSYLNEDTKNFATGGYQTQISNEISSNQEFSSTEASGYFIKSALSSEFYKSFWSNAITFNLSSSGGVISNPDNSPIHVSDRFYLGGSQSFKGFTKNSIKIGGANQFYKLDGSLLFRLPQFLYSPPALKQNEPNPLRLYVNGITGNVSDDVFHDGKSNTSVGFGIKYFNQWANFDLGYYISKRFNDSQFGIKDGLQFSLSIGGYKN